MTTTKKKVTKKPTAKTAKKKTTTKKVATAGKNANPLGISTIKSKHATSDMKYFTSSTNPMFQIRRISESSGNFVRMQIRVDGDTSDYGRARSTYTSYDMSLPVLEELIKRLKAQQVK